MPKYNYSTNRWEKTQEEIEEEQRKIIEEQQRQQQLAQQQQKKKKGFFDNLLSGWFKTPERLKDGYNPLKFELTKSLFDTGGQVATEFTKGILNIGEGIGDTINYTISSVADKLGAHEFAENLKEETKKDLFNNYLKPNNEIYGKNSITDNKTDNIVNSLGYMYGLYATAGLGSTTATQTAISTAVTFESSYGHALSEAYNAGASDKDARRYALISASAEAGSELMFGGIGKGSKAIGLSKSAIPLDDKVAKFASDRFKSTFAKNLTQWAIKSGGEGLEEVVSGTFSALGKKLTYMKDEDFKKILKDEQLLDQFISGAISAGISSGTGMAKATKAGQDYISGRTDAEQQIYDKMVENKTNELIASKNNDLKQKAIDDKVKEIIEQKKEKFKNAKIDEKAIRAEVENNIDFDDSTIKLSKKEISEINEEVDEAFEKGKLNLNDIYETFTPEETNKIARLEKELQNKNLTEEAKNGYEKELLETIKQRNETLTNESEKNAFLRHTLYNEEQRATNYKLTKEEQKLVESDEKLKNLYDDAVKYGNNSEEAHKFVNALAKMSTQTEYQYRLTNSEELEQLGYNVNKKYKVSNGDTLESIANKYKISTEDIKKANNLTGNNINVGQELIIPNKSAIINGLHDGDNKTIYINMDSENALNIIVGHETGHIFENTQEYKELQKMLFDVAEADGTLADRRAELESLYENVKNAKIDVELTNDLLGEKLFTDEKFIERLAQKPNLFTKIKDKIDDLVIQFKGTEEEKELRRIQNKFLEVYRRNDLQKYVAEADAKAKSKTKKSTDKKVDFMLQEIIPDEDSIDYVKRYMRDNDMESINSRTISELAESYEEQTDYDVEKFRKEVNNYIKEYGMDSLAEFEEKNGILYNNGKTLDVSNNDYAILISDYKNKLSEKNIDENKVAYAIYKKDGIFALQTSNYTYICNVYDGKVEPIIRIKAETNQDLITVIKERSMNNVRTSRNIDRLLNDIQNGRYRNGSYNDVIENSEATNKNARVDSIKQKSTNKQGDRTSSRDIQREVKDTSFSLSVKEANTGKDNNGNKLSKDQMEKFANSKITDEYGNLMEVYHGTHYDFDEFTKGSGEHGDGFYFAESFKYADEFANDDNGRVVRAYINMENPLSMNIDLKNKSTQKFISEVKSRWGLSKNEILDCFNSEDWSADLSAKIAEKMGYGKEDVENTIGFELESPDDIGTTDYNAYLGAYAWNNGLNDLVRKCGFDGIISKVYNSDSDGNEYIVFNNNQIQQLKDNENITSIDYSLSKNKIQGLEDYSKEQIYDLTKDYINTALLYSDIDAEIKGMEIIGSRNRGTAKENSDLDIVVELDGDNLREDDLFNVLNDSEEPLEINGIKVDINPIVNYRSGTLEEFMKRSNQYDQDILKNQKFAPIKTNNLNEYIADVSAREAKQNALDKESVRQSIIDYLEENNITNPTKEDMMNAFDDYDVMDNSDTLNDANKAEKLYSEVADEILKENNSKYSLSKNNNTELNNYLEKNNFKLDDNGSLEYKELSNKQINSLVSIYRKNGYSDVSADYLRERLKESGRLKIPREVADRFIEKELGYKPVIDTTKVFEDAEGNKLTKNQVEFYKDSDVRDIRGRLIPVYHRTNAEFTIFDKKAGKQHGNKYGRGFYFSINPENYGNNEMKVYLNAKDGEYKYIPDMGYYIVQEPNMIKNVDNLNPTSNEDIRYSISKKGKLVDNKGNDVRLDVSDVGNTGTLMAIHNLNAEKLNGIIDLGGFPVPSIAITNPDIVNHKQFGNISVLFDKSTIDPANRLNEVYDRDVWSPTFPTIEYEINDDGIEKVAKNLGIEEWKLRDAVEDNSKPEYLIERLLREEQLIDKYVKDNNINYETTYKDAETKVDMHQSGEKIRQFIIDNDFDFKKLYKNKKLQQEYFDLIKDYYDNSTFPQAVKENLYNEKISQLKDFIDIQKGAGDLEPVRQLKRYQDDFDLIKSGENKIIDEWQTNKNKKDVAVENGIEDYLKNQIKDVYGDKGIRNDREIFTPSGNRRSFWQLHDEYNLENIVDALTKGDTTGTQNWFAGYGQIQANMANQFNSISDIKANENRLTSLAENNTILEEARNNIENDIDEIVAKNDTDINIASELLADFARGDLTIDNFKELTRNYYQTTQNVSDELINKIIDDLNNLKDLPTDYFEAKPQRAVGLDEIQSVVLPTSTDESLKNKLKELNIDYVEYNPEIEGDRQRVINQFDNLKFSLSRKNNLAPIRGDYQVYSKDIRNNNLAPIREDITKKPASKNVNYSLLEEPEEINPLEDRNMDEVGKRDVKAYQYENPEVKSYFQQMAKLMKTDLDNSVKGEKYAIGDMDYRGTTRQTTDDIAYLLDEYNYSYDDIKKGLNAIIEDHGAENIAVAKRIELLLNDRLLNGYKDSYGYDIPADEEYIDLVKNMNKEKNLAPIKDEVDYSAFDDMLPIKNELERLDAKEEERLRKKREKYQQQIEQAKKVSKQKKSEFRKNYDNFKTLFINENAEVDNLAKESGNKKLTYKADMLNNYVVEAENDINNYQTDYNGKEIGKSVKQLFEPAKNKGLYEAFNDYLINYSNIDRHKQGKGSLRWESTSQDLINQYEKKYPEFKKWAKDVWQYGKNALNTMEQSGLIDSKLKQRLTEMYPHYVPFMDNVDLNMYIGANDEIVPKKTIKSAKGGMSTTEMLPMEDALTRYAYSYRKSMRQNDLYSEIVKTLRANEIDTGMDVREEATDLQDSLYRDENGNYLKAYIDGDTKVVSISNDLYRALQNDLKNQVKDLEDRLSLITKPLQKATRIKGNLVTSWSPTFIFKNFFKDFQDAMFNSTDTKKFIKNYPSAFNELRKNDTKLVRQFRAMYGSAVGQYTGSDTGAMKQATKTKNPFKKFANANEIIELAPRYAEFKASLENGATIEEAMYNAREVTTNFSRGGTITKAINRNGFNFVNASTQGLSKFIRNFTGQNGAKGFTHALVKAVEFGVAPALFNELVFGSGDDKDEDYDALPDYVKDNYYLFKYGDNKFIRIPKGRALSVFGSGARRTLEYMNGEKDAFDGYLTNTWNQIGINNPEESFLFTPIMQAKNNKAWYGGDIVPTRLQDKPAGEQYDEKTDAFSKWLGKTLNVSPKKINYVIDQYSGGLGDIALPFITPEAQSEYDNPAGRALAPIRDQFVVNSIDDNKYVSDFYTNNDKLKVQANSEYATDEDALRYKYSNSVSSELSALYKEKRLIQNDSSLSNSEKYKKAQAIKQQINEIAKEGLDNYKKVNVVGNYAEVNDKEYYRNNKGEWTKAKEEDIEEMNKFGLTTNEKNNYYNSKNNISNITSRYKSLSENATDEEKTQLSTLKKNDIINTIKATNISNDAKAYLYSKYYSSADKMNVISTLDISMDKYLDFELQNFKADKNIYGQTIKNSKKTKMINYINNMSGTYGEKIIIYKLNNMSDNSYNQDIVNYINRQNISMEEKRTLLKELGMKVDYAGNVRW